MNTTPHARQNRAQNPPAPIAARQHVAVRTEGVKDWNREPASVSETEPPDLLDQLTEILRTEALHEIDLRFPPYPSEPRGVKE